MRANLIKKLRTEHVNMRRVTEIIRIQLELLEQQDEPDFVLLTNALHYMRRFPSAVHHPKEDIIFSALLAAGAPLQSEVETLRQQHQEIYALEDQLMELVVEAQKAEQSAVESLLELGKQYLQLQSVHVKTEEHTMFPEALKRLTPKDWRALRDASDKIEDPLSGKSVAEPYRYLYEYLLREAAEDGLSLPDHPH